MPTPDYKQLQFCSKCGKPLVGVYLLCDRKDGQWCEDCFDQTACGKGKHGEGCFTKVFEDD